MYSMVHSVKKLDQLEPVPLLQVHNLTVFYGIVEALKKISFSINFGEIVTMIGPNGAGKSTALKAICGLVKSKCGDIFFQGENIKGIKPYELVKKGISLVPEGRRVFPTMTVLENLEMGAFSISNKKVIQKNLERIFDLFPVLKDKSLKKTANLSTGEQQMLAIGRALILEPKLLLADEPSLGLAPFFVDQVFKKLIEINKNGTSILLVEQNASMALEIANRGYVFQIGEIFLESSGKDLLKNNEVKKTFLGG